MFPFNRLPKKVLADQFFPTKKIDVPGFKNILQKVYNDQMHSMEVVTHGEIELPNRKVLRVNPGDWVVVDETGMITIKNNEEFKNEYEPIDSCPTPQVSPQS